MSKLTLKKYIEMKGVNQVARECGVESATVSAWKNFKTVPRPHLAHLLIQMTNGLLSWESIYKTFVDHNDERQLKFDFIKE